jgi:hypothetical protein
VVSLFERPLFTDSTIFSVRSSEYALMLSHDTRRTIIAICCKKVEGR